MNRRTRTYVGQWLPFRSSPVIRTVLHTMSDTDYTLQLIEGVCKRPRMYTLNGTFGEVSALLTGTVLNGVCSDERDTVHKVFNCFVTSRLLAPSKFWWTGAIRSIATDDDDAIQRVGDFFSDFVRLRLTHTLEEIRVEAENRVASYEESEPAAAWRRFMAARFHANQFEIESLILPHPDARYLWAGGGAPLGVAEQLISISDLGIVSIVAGSVESGQVTLMTELGKIDAQLVDGDWRIDAARIIEIDKQNAEP